MPSLVCSQFQSVNRFPLPLSAQDIIKEQTRDMRSTQRQITRDRTTLEKEEKQLVGAPHTYAHVHAGTRRRKFICLRQISVCCINILLGPSCSPKAYTQTPNAHTPIKMHTTLFPSECDCLIAAKRIDANDVAQCLAAGT